MTKRWFRLFFFHFFTTKRDIGCVLNSMPKKMIKIKKTREKRFGGTRLLVRHRRMGERTPKEKKTKKEKKRWTTRFHSTRLTFTTLVVRSKAPACPISDLPSICRRNQPTHQQCVLSTIWKVKIDLKKKWTASNRLENKNTARRKKISRWVHCFTN